MNLLMCNCYISSTLIHSDSFAQARAFAGFKLLSSGSTSPELSLSIHKGGRGSSSIDIFQFADEVLVQSTMPTK